MPHHLYSSTISVRACRESPSLFEHLLYSSLSRTERAWLLDSLRSLEERKWYWSLEERDVVS